MRAWGAPDAIVEAWAARARDEPLPVFEENWPAVELFLASATQWRHAGMSGVPTGLDYEGVLAAARLSGAETTPEIFDGLRVMEAEALRVMRRRFKR